MLYAISCQDKPEAVDLRLATREAHLAYVERTGCVKLAGPILAEDETTMIGSLIVIEASSLKVAKDWADADPYNQAGLFKNVEVRPWKWVVGAPDA